MNFFSRVHFLLFLSFFSLSSLANFSTELTEAEKEARKEMERNMLARFFNHPFDESRLDNLKEVLSKQSSHLDPTKRVQLIMKNTSFLSIFEPTSLKKNASAKNYFVLTYCNYEETFQKRLALIEKEVTLIREALQALPKGKKDPLYQEFCKMIEAFKIVDFFTNEVMLNGDRIILREFQRRNGRPKEIVRKLRLASSSLKSLLLINPIFGNFFLAHENWKGVFKELAPLFLPRYFKNFDLTTKGWEIQKELTSLMKTLWQNPFIMPEALTALATGDVQALTEKLTKLKKDKKFPSWCLIDLVQDFSSLFKTLEILRPGRDFFTREERSLLLRSLLTQGLQLHYCDRDSPGLYIWKTARQYLEMAKDLAERAYDKESKQDREAIKEDLKLLRESETMRSLYERLDHPEKKIVYIPLLKGKRNDIYLYTLRCITFASFIHEKVVEGRVVHDL